MVNFHRYVFKVMIMREFGYIILEKCSGRQFLSTGAQTEKPQSPLVMSLDLGISCTKPWILLCFSSTQ